MASAGPATSAGGLPEPFRYAGGPFVCPFPQLAALPRQLLLCTRGAVHAQPMMRTATAAPAPLSGSVSLQHPPVAALPLFASPLSSTASASASPPASSSPLKAALSHSSAAASDPSLHVSAFSAFVPAALNAAGPAAATQTGKQPPSVGASGATSSTGRPASSVAIASLLNLSHSGPSPSTSSGPSVVAQSAGFFHSALRAPKAAVKSEQQPRQPNQQWPVSAPTVVHTASPAALIGGPGSSSGRAADSSFSLLEATAHKLTERLAEADGQAAALGLLRSLSTSPSGLAAVQSLVDTASRHLSDPSTTAANFLISLTAWLVSEVAVSAPPAVCSPLSPFSAASASSLSKGRRSSLPPLSAAASDSDDDTCPHCCAQKKGTRWSDKDDSSMLAMLKHGSGDWDHIAKTLKRTVRALKDRYCYLRKQSRQASKSDKKRKRRKRDELSEHASSDFDSDYSSTDDDRSDVDTHRASQRPASLPSRPYGSSASSTSSSSTSHSNPSLGSSLTSQRSRSNDSAGRAADSPPCLSPPSSPSSAASPSRSSASSSSSSSSASSPASCAPATHPWRESEEAQLFALLSAGRTIREASRQLGRSVAAVKGRLQRLKLGKLKRGAEQQQRPTKRHLASEDDMDVADVADEVADSIVQGEVQYKVPMTQVAAALLLAGV